MRFVIEMLLSEISSRADWPCECYRINYVRADICIFQLFVSDVTLATRPDQPYA